jgi:hypothetical protein
VRGPFLLVTVLTAACGGPPQNVPRPVTGPYFAPPPDPARLDAVFLLESGGPPPDDTVVVAAAGQRRVVMLRRGAPDNSLFATITLPDSAGGRAGDSTRLTIRQRPGIYGLDLEIEGPFAGGAELVMSYAVHFVAPAGARERYGNDLDFERALFIARVMPDSQVVFLPTGRPGSDLISATVPGSGRYVVAAPRS